MPYPAKTSREAILTVAIEHLGREGAQGLSLRAIAASLHIAPNALYRYYADRDALLAALADEGARRLLASMQQMVGNQSGVEAIRLLAKSYLDYALAHSELYQVVMMRHASLVGRATAYDDLWPFVVKTVQSLVSEQNAPRAAVALWSFLHGSIGIERAELFHEGKPQDGITFGLEAFLNGIQHTIL